MSNKSKATLEIIMPLLEEAVEKLLRKVEKDSLLEDVVGKHGRERLVWVGMDNEI